MLLLALGCSGKDQEGNLAGQAGSSSSQAGGTAIEAGSSSAEAGSSSTEAGSSSAEAGSRSTKTDDTSTEAGSPTMDPTDPAAFGGSGSVEAGGALGEGGHRSADTGGSLGAGGDPTAQGGSTSAEAGSELARDTSPAVPVRDSNSLAIGNLAFATELYARLSRTDGNLFFSPFSISEALAMVWAGATGNTAEEMADTLHFELPPAQLHTAFNALDLNLMSRATDAAACDRAAIEGECTPFELTVENSLFGQLGYAFEQKFLDTLAVNYGARINLVDYMADAEGARNTINSWIADKTADRIVELIPRNAISADTRLVLANAIYYKAGWATPFDTTRTQAGPFVLLDGTEGKADFMNQTVFIDHAVGDGWQAIDLPYIGDQLAMTLLLPDTGRFEEVEGKLSSTFVTALFDAFAQSNIAVTIPKWTFDSRFSLSDDLSALGMPTAFTSDADFSAMCTTDNLFISQVIHQAFVGVDELGTEAAAATAVVMDGTGVPQQSPSSFIADRPFIFFIHDRPTGAMLFLGRVVEAG